MLAACLAAGGGGGGVRRRGGPAHCAPTCPPSAPPHVCLPPPPPSPLTDLTFDDSYTDYLTGLYSPSANACGVSCTQTTDCIAFRYTTSAYGSNTCELFAYVGKTTPYNDVNYRTVLGRVAAVRGASRGGGGGGGRGGCVGREARDVCACEHPRCSSPGRAPPHPPHNAQAATPGAASPGQTAAASSIFALTTGTGSAPTTPAARVLQATCPTTSTEPAVREGGGGGSHVCMGAADCTTPSPTRSPPPTPVRSARQPRVRPAS